MHFICNNVLYVLVSRDNVLYVLVSCIFRAFSSFSNSSYGSGEKYAKTDSSMAWPGHKSSCPASPPGYYNHHKTIATAPRHNGYHQESMDTDDDMPLNLTKSSSSHQSNSSTSSASATCPVSTTTSWGSRSSHSPPTSSLTPRHTVIIRNAPSHQLTGGATQPMCNNSRQDKVLSEYNHVSISYKSTFIIFNIKQIYPDKHDVCLLGKAVIYVLLFKVTCFYLINQKKL